MQRTGVSPADTFEAFRDKFAGESERMFDDVYAGWSAEAKRIGGPLTLVILPRSDSKDKSPRLLRYIHAVADRHGLDRLDVSDAFDDLEVTDFRLSRWDKHPECPRPPRDLQGYPRCADQTRRPPGLTSRVRRRRTSAEFIARVNESVDSGK